MRAAGLGEGPKPQQHSLPGSASTHPQAQVLALMHLSPRAKAEQYGLALGSPGRGEAVSQQCQQVRRPEPGGSQSPWAAAQEFTGPEPSFH